MSQQIANIFKISNLFDVSGLVCVVTGGGTGIGLMITKALASNGARVYIVGRRKEVLEKTALENSVGLPDGAAILPVQGDTTDKKSIEGVLAEIKKKEKYIDLLVNNAGVGGPLWNAEGKKGAEDIGKTLFECDYEEAVTLFRTNCLGYFYVSAAFIQLLDKSPNHPQIINITSNASFGREAMAGILYSMSKAASTHLTKMLSTHLKDTKVRCNAIAPGAFPSELVKGKDATGSDNKTKADLSDNLGLPVSASTGGGLGTDEDMATTVLYMANKKQRYMTGGVVLIDGGVLNTMPSSF